ncbi:hypothetical protein [Mycobacterium sp. UM_WGJ]|uniref:hypothetical protein n=1 Tax=Mycobacterium sp. UM_WGJ TaxID=1370120 RepID=UPI0004642909|nr:hypothetical protein [Mycobacterium sp. UM_WGJ]
MNDWQATSDRLGGISRSTVFGLWYSGELGSVKIGKRRFSTDKQIDEFVQRLERKTGGDAA